MTPDIELLTQALSYNRFEFSNSWMRIVEGNSTGLYDAWYRPVVCMDIPFSSPSHEF